MVGRAAGASSPAPESVGVGTGAPPRAASYQVWLIRGGPPHPPRRSAARRPPPQGGRSRQGFDLPPCGGGRPNSVGPGGGWVTNQPDSVSVVLVERAVRAAAAVEVLRAAGEFHLVRLALG